MTKFKIKYPGGTSRYLQTMKDPNERQPWYTIERGERPFMGRDEAEAFVAYANRVFGRVYHCLVEVG